MSIRLSNGSEIPIEMHKIRIVQKVRLTPARDRLRAIEAGCLSRGAYGSSDGVSARCVR